MAQILFNILITGSVYALVAAGFSLIYSVCRFINFAHGGIIAIAGYLLYLFYFIFEINFATATFLTLLITALVGYFINVVFYKNLRKRKASAATMLIAGLAILVLVESFIQIFFGSDYKSIRFINTNIGHDFLGGYITNLQLFIVIISLLLFIILFGLIKYTKLGKAFRAVSDNRSLAEIVGISAENIYSYVFLIASFMAGIAGVLIGLEQGIYPLLGSKYIIAGFTAAIIGGIGSIYGAILGSLILGLFENIGVSLLPSLYKEFIVFIFLLFFLLFRPQGLLGIKKNILDA